MPVTYGLRVTQMCHILPVFRMAFKEQAISINKWRLKQVDGNGSCRLSDKKSSSKSLPNCFIDHKEPPNAADEPPSERASIAIEVIDGRRSCLCVGRPATV
jgi:hypothetical protein